MIGTTLQWYILSNVFIPTFSDPLNFDITAPSAQVAAPDKTEEVTEKSKCSFNIVPRYLYLYNI